MKITTEMFDFVLLLVLLGLMLPFLFGQTTPLTDMNSWGFAASDDKTMKQHGGDVLPHDELYADDSMTAAEIVLLTRVYNHDTVRPSRYRLPDGSVITVDNDYAVFMDESTAKAQAVLDPARRYRLVYDYGADVWVLQ